MATSLQLADPAALGDLDTFLGRAMQVEDGAARLVAADGVLAVYVPVLFPSGLLDDAATVLGLRTFALAEPSPEVDQVVPMASLRARAAAGGFELGMPTPVYSVTWAGVVPPRSGWRSLDAPVASELLEREAAAGIAAVAEALPDVAGDAIVRQVRAAVWGEPIADAPALPRGAALAAATLGFLPPAGAEPDVGAVYEVGPWTRLTLSRGHVLVKRRSWSLAT